MLRNKDGPSKRIDWGMSRKTRNFDRGFVEELKPARPLKMNRPGWKCLPSIHGDGQLGHAAVEEIQRIPRVF